jgi:hypothetical protein
MIPGGWAYDKGAGIKAREEIRGLGDNKQNIPI